MLGEGNLSKRAMRFRTRWVRLSPLGRDIALILVVKFAALGLLWWAFFSHPVAPHMSVEASRVEAHIIPFASPEEPTRATR
jgi:uncharacterized membrane protein